MAKEDIPEGDLDQLIEDWPRMREEISKLKKRNEELEANIRDVLRILGVTSGIPFVQPKMTMLPEQEMRYDDALERLRHQYFDFPEDPSSARPKS
jgi:hypothetical protein